MVLGFIVGMMGMVNLVLGLMKWLNPMTWVLMAVKHILHAMVLVLAIAGLVGVVALVWAFFFGPMQKMNPLRGMCPIQGMCRVPRETKEEGGSQIPIE